MWFMQDELVLFRKMQEGDWSAFNSFFESYSEQLYLYALGFVGDRAEENFPFRFSLCLFKSFRQKLLYRSQTSRGGGATLPARNDGVRGRIE